MKTEKKKIILKMLSVFLVCGYAFVGQTTYLEAANGPYASNLDPADGAGIDGEVYPDPPGPPTHIWTMLIFNPGSTAVKHTTYFSDDYSKVYNRHQDANLGQPPYPYPGWDNIYFAGNPEVPPAIDSLVRGMTYYWCVDETDGNNVVWQGPVWSFYVLSYYATNPDPPNEAIYVNTDVLLSWRPGYQVDVHDVYIGTSWEDVNNADEFDITGIYQGWMIEPNYQCSNLAFNTKYYWRVDEVNGRSFPGSGTIYKGDVWCFTTRPAVLGLFIDIDAAGANNGSSWADAFNHLQDALSIARYGDEIHVAQGTYNPDLGAGITPGDRNATFQLIGGITVKGGYAGFGEPDPNARDIELYETILTGDISGNDVEVADPCDLVTEPTRDENSYHVVTASWEGAEAGTVLEGFIITGGNANWEPPWPYDHRMKGGGMYCSEDSGIVVTNCLFHGNSAIWGGGMYLGCGAPFLTNCTFRANAAEQHAGAIEIEAVWMLITNNAFIDNFAGVNGGAVWNFETAPVYVSCIFIGNAAGRDGGAMWNVDSSGYTLINCTLANNTAAGVGGAIDSDEWPILTNCILWSNRDGSGMGESSHVHANHGPPAINYCCVQGWTGVLSGTGNIGEDPLFVDADGIDNIIGTEDDNLRLLLGSPCIDAGDNSVVWVTTDLDGNPRIRGGAVDMGAYEANITYHVDGVNGDNTNDGLTPETAFKTIQRGINAAKDSEAVFVWPGVYNEEISFRGDAITVKSAADAAIVETNHGYAFSFSSAEGPNTVLSNFIIRNSQYGIYLINGSSPILRNLTIVNNDFGISAFNGADPDISNCILWGNYFGDLFREPVPLEAKYSWVEGEVNEPIAHWKFGEGSGNIAYDSVGNNNGTVYGAEWTTGIIDGALDFDGVDDYIDMADTVKGQLGTNYTVSVWIKTKTISGIHSIAAYRRSTYDIGYQVLLHLQHNNSDVQFTVGSLGNNAIASYPNALSTNTWYHVVGIREGTVLNVYVNGVSGIPDSETFGEISPDNFKIGAIHCCGQVIQSFFDGTIDDVRIYDRALYAEEVQCIYQNVVDPGFVDANGGDYHLLSERGRYWPAHDVWVLDDITSPCIDGGDPNVRPSNEPMPNGGRINMGAYGNTAYASMSEWPIKGDINRDGRFNFVDIAILLDEWLAELDWAQ